MVSNIKSHCQCYMLELQQGLLLQPVYDLAAASDNSACACAQARLYGMLPILELVGT